MASNYTPYRSEADPSPATCGCLEDACVKTGYHYADISVPIELKPSATLGAVVVECCGEPAVTCRDDDCGNTCEVTITQKVSIQIPIHYQVAACMGESSIDCDCDTSCCP